MHLSPFRVHVFPFSHWLSWISSIDSCGVLLYNLYARGGGGGALTYNDSIGMCGPLDPLFMPCQPFQSISFSLPDVPKHIFFIDQPVPMPTQLKSQFSRPPFHVKSQFPRPPFGEGRLVLKPLGSNKQPFLRVWFQILGPHTPTLSKC